MSDQPSVRSIRYPTDSEVRIVFADYVAAVGRVAHAWNYLHETLGRLFVRIVGGHSREVTAAIWYSPFSDRAQREMLKEALSACGSDSAWQRLPEHARTDLFWLLEQANKLGFRRDDAVHAPCILITSVEGTEMGSSVLSGHRRARNLVGKDILTEFDWLERYIEGLNRFTGWATEALTIGNPTWPERPSPPDRRAKKNLQSARQSPKK